jgi:UDP-N-acetylmuramoyl-L-alanyl-D-glutamate--2,6-diaminopimelate ligase
VSIDHRTTQPGDLFCAVRGARSDGADFAGFAADRGAAALLVPHQLATPLPQIVVPERQMRREVARVSNLVYAEPSQRLTMIGVTGTNGKTTVVHLISQVLSRCGVTCRELGTLWGRLTTPEAPDLHRQLALFLDQGAEACAMEVSSIALEMHRVDFVDFDVAIFTNLSQDHMDLHGTMEEYFAAKAKLFQPELARFGVVATGDGYGKRLVDSAGIPVVPVDLSEVDNVVHHARGVRFEIDEVGFDVPLLGAHNLMNVLCALRALRHLGYELPRLAKAFAGVTEPAGRLEFVPSDAPFHVVVDYAHTPAALEAVLTSLRVRVGESGRLVCVVGCGGDRDRGKRPDMGRIASALADRAVFTSDNPRSESPAQILADMMAGVGARDDVVVTEDRAVAISEAIRGARSGDVILIAGKGHENKQVIGDEEIPFSDVEVARRALADEGWSPE